MLCPKRLLLAGLLCVVLSAGCQIPPAPVKTALPVSAAEHRAEPELTAVLVPEPLTIAPPAPLPEHSPESAPLFSTLSGRLWPRSWENAWVPLESWGQFNGIGKPVQLSPGAQPVYQLTTSNGLMILKIGSQVANIAGIQYGLGFAPRLIKGLPYIHSLDARKTLQALAEGFLPIPATNRTIVIDAGHGGRDSGTRSPSGEHLEKHYTLDWANRLARLMANQGWKVVMTRTNDYEVSLTDRVARAEDAGADLFLSLHFNSGGANRELSGVETYCLTPTGMPSNLVREYEDDPREAHPNNVYDEHNMQLASRIHRSLLQASGAIDRGVRHARFMAVLRGQQRPAVLVEGGYLSNPAEAQKIAQPEYRQMLAEGVARALE